MLQPVSSETVPPLVIEGDFSEEECHAMQRATLKLFEHWGLTDAEAVILLGGISLKTYRRWRAGEYGRVARDLADRMSNMLGIHKALRIIFKEPADGYRWIKAPNDAFAGKSAFDIMSAGAFTDILRVRRYLDSVRGGW